MEDTIVFVLLSSDKDTRYQFEYKKTDQNDNLDIQANVKHGKYASRFVQSHIDVLETMINLSDKDSFKQYYYVSIFGKIELIYPFQSK